MNSRRFNQSPAAKRTLNLVSDRSSTRTAAPAVMPTTGNRRHESRDQSAGERGAAGPGRPAHPSPNTEQVARDFLRRTTSSRGSPTSCFQMSAARTERRTPRIAAEFCLRSRTCSCTTSPALHDGRTSDIVTAIKAHGGEATRVVNNFNGVSTAPDAGSNLSVAESQNLVYFLRSL